MSNLEHLRDELEQHLATLRNREEAIEDATEQARQLAARGAIERDEEQALNQALRNIVAMLNQDRRTLRDFRIKLVDAIGNRASLYENLAREAEKNNGLEWWQRDGAAIPPYADNWDE